jgi:hypothetical protein
MRVLKPILLAFLASIFLLVRPANSQQFGIYSNLSTNEETGQVYVYAETYTDYSVGYYYDVYVGTDLGVFPAEGSPYSTCLRSDWSPEGWAWAECETTVTGSATLNLISQHHVEITYNVYNFEEFCYYEGICDHWWDQYDMWNLGLRGVGYEDNMSWFCYGLPTVNEERRTTDAVLDRPGQITPCPYPTGETSAFVTWGLYDDMYNGEFDVTVTGGPQNANYQNRKVYETLSNWWDGCYDNGQGGSVTRPMPPEEYWSWWWIGSDRKYTERDRIGTDYGWINYYVGRHADCDPYPENEDGSVQRRRPSIL